MENCLPYPRPPDSLSKIENVTLFEPAFDDIHRINADRLNERDEWQSKFSLVNSRKSLMLVVFFTFCFYFLIISVAVRKLDSLDDLNTTGCCRNEMH